MKGQKENQVFLPPMASSHLDLESGKSVQPLWPELAGAAFLEALSLNGPAIRNANRGDSIGSPKKKKHNARANRLKPAIRSF